MTKSIQLFSLLTGVFLVQNGLSQSTFGPQPENKAAPGLDQHSLLIYEGKTGHSYQINPQTPEKGSEIYKREADSWLPASAVPDIPATDYPAHWIDEQENLLILSGQRVDDGTFTDQLLIYNPQEEKLEKQLLPESFIPRMATSFCQDSTASLWLFGGKGKEDPDRKTDLLNDLWYYSQGEWKQMIPEGETLPSPRMLAVLWCLSDRLLLYGGMAEENGGWTRKADLWVYHLEKNVWEQIEIRKPSDRSTVMAFPAMFHDFNWPGLRVEATGWKDAENGLWLYGGQTIFSQEHISHESALWKLDPKTYQWAFYPTEQTDYLIKPKLVLPKDDGSLEFMGCQLMHPFKQPEISSAIFTLKSSAK